MTVSTTVLRNDYTGNGVTTAFTIGFYFLDNTHLNVIQTQISTGTTSTLALTTNYTVTGAGNPAGGTLTTLAVLTSDQKISILRNVPQTQLVHYVLNDPFPAATHEMALDQLTMEIQQIQENVNRALTLSPGSSGISSSLPAPVANNLIGWSTDALSLQNYAGASSVLVSAAMTPVVQGSTLAIARTAMGLGTGDSPTFAGLNAISATVNSLTTQSINNGPLYGNRIINSNKDYAQWGPSATITAGTAVPTVSTGYYTADRFYSYCTGANVAVAWVNGANAQSKRTQYTGAASVTAIGEGQRIEAIKSYDLAGNTCRYTVEIGNTLLTTATWTAYYANTKDTFGTIGTPTKTQIATGTFTINSTVTAYGVSIAVPSAAVTGIEIVLTVGAQTSGTHTVGRWDFRPGTVSPTFFDNRPNEQQLCQQYYFKNGNRNLRVQSGGAGNFIIPQSFPITMRAAPTVLIGTPTYITNSGLGNPISADVECISWNWNAGAAGDSSVTFTGYGFAAEIP